MINVERCISRGSKSNEGKGKYWARELRRIERVKVRDPTFQKFPV